MDVPIYKLDLLDNSYNFERNKIIKKINLKKSIKESNDSNLFSQESQLNISTTSIDKNESFWQSLRNIWSKKIDTETNAINENSIKNKIDVIMNNLDETEHSIKELYTKVNDIESVLKPYYDGDKTISLKDIFKSVQKLHKKFEKTNYQYVSLQSRIEAMQTEINNNIDTLDHIAESIEFQEESTSVVSQDILSKFETILQNSLSDQSAEILLHWNDVLFNIYSNSSLKLKPVTLTSKKKCKIVEFHKSPGVYLIDSLRRSERLQNKIELHSDAFQKINTQKTNTRQKHVKEFNDTTHQSRSMKRSVEIFKYYEESTNGGNSEVSKKRNRSQISIDQYSKNNNGEIHCDGGTSNCDSDVDLVSLRKLFNC